ncbi:hypothetical protein UlMin_019619 [Ulmus minor]
MVFKSKIKWISLLVVSLSLVSLVQHLSMARFSTGIVKPLHSLHPYANPKTSYLVPNQHSNGFIYAKIFGGFQKITSLTLPNNFKAARKKNAFPTFKPKTSASPNFYIDQVLPKLRKNKVIGLVISDGGCLQSILPSSMSEFQRLRCRAAFHALQFYVDSHLRRENGSCPLMPEECCTVISRSQHKVHYILGQTSADWNSPPKTIIYLAGSETFGDQRVLTPLRAMFANLVDRTSLCSKTELLELLGPETPLPLDPFQSPPSKSEEQLKQEWKKAGPQPRPLPPPPDRPMYRREKEGWYGWITETDIEPDPTPMNLRMQAHRLVWDALDYLVSVEADAFIPGYNDDGSGWPDFSSLVMAHWLYEVASSRTYRPDRYDMHGILVLIYQFWHPIPFLGSYSCCGCISDDESEFKLLEKYGFGIYFAFSDF